MVESALKLEDLTKAYAGGFHLGPINLGIAPGHAVAILGKNGSGKSTLFQVITGNQDATEGRVHVGDRVMHREAYELKRRVGYLPQHMDLPRWVTAGEILSYAAFLFGLSEIPQRVAEAATLWDFTSYIRTPLANCSYGMQKRVGLALATFHDPDILILDEPFSGLDLFHIRALEEAIARRKKAARVTILSTHVVSYAARHCHEAYIIENGVVMPVASWATLDFTQRIDAVERLFFSAAR